MLPALNTAENKYLLVRVNLIDTESPPLEVVKNEQVKPIVKPAIRTEKIQETIAAKAFSILGISAFLATHPTVNKLSPFTLSSRGALCSTSSADKAKINEQVKKFSMLRQKYETLQCVDIKEDNVCEYKSQLNKGYEDDVLAFSKQHNGEEMVIVYNSCSDEAREKFVKVDNAVNCKKDKMVTLYGHDSCGFVNVDHGMVDGESISFIKLYLKPLHLVILKSI